MTQDAELLRRYAAESSEAAFVELVIRHLNFVYSAALRMTNGDAHLAHDVTQAVFTDVARKAHALASHRGLTGWLYTSTRFARGRPQRGRPNDEPGTCARESNAHGKWLAAAEISHTLLSAAAMSHAITPESASSRLVSTAFPMSHVAWSTKAHAAVNAGHGMTNLSRPLLRLFSLALLASSAFGRLASGEFLEVNPIAQPPAGRTVIISGARLIDGCGGPPVENAAVVVRGSRIEAVGPRDTIQIPAGAEHVDATGLTLLPGLVDAHFHGGPRPEIPAMFLRAGVTAARDPGVGWEHYEAALQRGMRIPRIFFTGRHLDQEPAAHPKNARIVRTTGEAVAAVNDYVDRGATAIKVYFRLPPDLIRAVCDAADAHGIPVVAHLELVDATVAIAAGIDGLEHVSSVGTSVADPHAAEAFRTAVDADNRARITGRYALWAGLDLESPRVRNVIALMKRQRVVMSPTLTYFYGGGPGSKSPTDEHRRGFANMLGFVRKCHEAGVSVVAGSHTMLAVEPEGKAQQKEMELLAEAGLSPMEAIVAATLESAKYLRAEKRIGSIEPGKLADLILVEGDPLQDLRVVRNIRRVMLNGVWVEENPTP